MAGCGRQVTGVMMKMVMLARASKSQLLSPAFCLTAHWRRFSNKKESDTYYQALRSSLEQQLKPPEYFNLAKDIVTPWAERKPQHPALLLTDGQTDTVLTYRSLLDQAQTLATTLANPRPPTCALVLLPKVAQWWVVNVAAAWCGSIISPGTTQLTVGDVRHRLNESKADCVICTAEMAKDLDHITVHIPRRIVVTDNINDEVMDGWESYNELMEGAINGSVMECVRSKGSDVTQVFFTSGTTGSAKMVPHTHASYGIGHIVTSRYWLDVQEDDVAWNISDTGWAKTAWSSLYVPLIAGATAFIHKMPRFDADEVVRTLHQYPVTVLCAPPTAYRAVVQCQNFGRLPFCALRHCVSAGEPLNPEVMYAWNKETGLQIYEGYGQSESTLLAGVCPGMKVRPGSMGRPAPGYKLMVLDDSYQELGPHKEGHLAVSLKDGHPVGLFTGYLNDNERTREVFVDGYYLTKDRAYYDEDGYFWFVSRDDDVIISSGYRIGPFEVESSLLEHPSVAESAVVSSPDSLRGEVVKAFVVLTDGYHNHHDKPALVSELQHHVKHNTAPYKYPRKIEFVDRLPKTVSGKIRRVELRNKEWGRD